MFLAWGCSYSEEKCCSKRGFWQQTLHSRVVRVVGGLDASCERDYSSPTKPSRFEPFATAPPSPKVCHHSFKKFFLIFFSDNFIQMPPMNSEHESTRRHLCVFIRLLRSLIYLFNPSVSMSPLTPIRTRTSPRTPTFCQWYPNLHTPHATNKPISMEQAQFNLLVNRCPPHTEHPTIKHKPHTIGTSLQSLWIPT